MKKDVNKTVEFLLTIVKGHFLAFACKQLKITKVSDKLPNLTALKQGSDDKKKAFITNLAESVVEEFALVEEAFNYKQIAECDNTDHVYNYARTICHYGSLIMEFMDAWAEGDGERIYTCWQVFLPHFYNHSTRSKYAVEAVRLQLQQQVLSNQLSHELIWGRFVNLKGGAGNNLPSDLVNEFINKDIKDIIRNMGSNVSENALKRAARSISKIKATCTNFDTVSNIHPQASAHAARSLKEDINKVVSSVLKNKLLQVDPNGRKHAKYPQISLNPLNNLDTQRLLTYIENKIKDTVKKQKQERLVLL